MPELERQCKIYHILARKWQYFDRGLEENEKIDVSNVVKNSNPNVLRNLVPNMLSTT